MTIATVPNRAIPLPLHHPKIVSFLKIIAEVVINDVKYRLLGQRRFCRSLKSAGCLNLSEGVYTFQDASIIMIPKIY